MEGYQNIMYAGLSDQIQNSVELGIHSKIFYDGQEIRGTISYEDVEKYIKIGIFQNGEKCEEHLIIRNEYIRCGDLGKFSLGMRGIRYISLETGRELLRYEYFRGLTKDAKKSIKPVVSAVPNLELLEEKSFSDVLTRFEHVNSDYTAKDLLTVYEKYMLELDGTEKKQIKAL